MALVRADLLDRPYGDVVRTQRRTALVHGRHGGLNRGRIAGHTAQVFGRDSAGEVPLDSAYCFVHLQIAVVKTVRQDEDVRSKTIAPDVTALPHQIGPPPAEDRRNRTASQCAAGVMHAM